VHVGLGQHVHRVGCARQRDPVELGVGAGGEVQVAAVELGGDLGELAQLAAGQFAVGHGDARHRRMALDVPAVLQAQRAEVVVAQLARQVALELVTELCGTGAYKLAVEFGVLVHRFSSLCSTAAAGSGPIEETMY
jgi:hypothetical protein